MVSVILTVWAGQEAMVVSQPVKFVIVQNLTSEMTEAGGLGVSQLTRLLPSRPAEDSNS